MNTLQHIRCHHDLENAAVFTTKSRVYNFWLRSNIKHMMFDGWWGMQVARPEYIETFCNIAREEWTTLDTQEIDHIISHMQV